MGMKIILDSCCHKPHIRVMKKMIVPQTTGAKIALARRKRGLNQGELAELAGLSRQTVCQLEHDHYEPRIKTLRRLAKVLRVSVVSLWLEE